jgi:hypothetical protein
MADEPDSLVLVCLRRLDAGVADLGAAMGEVKKRVGTLEQRYASISRRLDRLDGDVQQIKRRLDLVEVE